MTITPCEAPLHSFVEAAFEEAVARMRRHKGFLGLATRDEFLSNVLTWRSFYQPSAFYGHRLACNVSIVSDYAGKRDIFTTDTRGLCKNSVDGEDADVRIRRARERGQPVLAFFGGSTMQGVGCRLPDFTIPALVERVLLELHAIPSVCLNHGVAGWTSAEQMHFLIHETDYKPDICVFYDGWNCCWTFFHALALNLAGVDAASPLHRPRWARGTSLRHVEHDDLNARMFSALFLGRRVVSLLVHRLLGWLVRASNRFRCSRVVSRLFQAAFPLRLPDALRHTQGLRLSERQRDALLQAVAGEYLAIDASAAAICAARGVRFHHFFQPLLVHTRKPLTASEQVLWLREQSTPHPEIFSIFHEIFRRPGLPDHLVDLSAALDDCSEELFVDGGHLNGHGNYRIALRIVQELLARHSLGQSGRTANVKEASSDEAHLAPSR